MGKLPKNIQLRYRVIDRLLRDYETVKTDVLINKIFERHDISVGKTTIQKDISADHMSATFTLTKGPAVSTFAKLALRA